MSELSIKQEDNTSSIEIYEDYEVLMELDENKFEFGLNNIDSKDVYYEEDSIQSEESALLTPLEKRNFAAELKEIRSSLKHLTKTVQSLVEQNEKICEILLQFDPELLISKSQESLQQKETNEGVLLQTNQTKPKLNKLVDAKFTFGIPVSSQEEFDLLGNKIANDEEFKLNLVSKYFIAEIVLDFFILVYLSR